MSKRLAAPLVALCALLSACAQSPEVDTSPALSHAVKVDECRWHGGTYLSNLDTCSFPGRGKGDRGYTYAPWSNQ